MASAARGEAFQLSERRAKSKSGGLHLRLSKDYHPNLTCSYLIPSLHACFLLVPVGSFEGRSQIPKGGSLHKWVKLRKLDIYPQCEFHFGLASLDRNVSNKRALNVSVIAEVEIYVELAHTARELRRRIGVAAGVLSARVVVAGHGQEGGGHVVRAADCLRLRDRT